MKPAVAAGAVAMVLLAGCTVPPSPRGVQAASDAFATLQTSLGVGGNLTHIRMTGGMEVTAEGISPDPMGMELEVQFYEGDALQAAVEFDEAVDSGLDRMALFCTPSLLVIGPAGLTAGTPANGSIETENTARTCQLLQHAGRAERWAAVQAPMQRLQAAMPQFSIFGDHGGDPFEAGNYTVKATIRTDEGWIVSIERPQARGEPMPYDVTIRHGRIERMVSHMEQSLETVTMTFDAAVQLTYGERPPAPDIRGEQRV